MSPPKESYTHRIKSTIAKKWSKNQADFALERSDGLGSIMLYDCKI